MQRTISVVFLLFVCLSCARNGSSPSPPRAAVLLRDGTQVAGGVTATSASEITIKGDDGISRTIPMVQVRSVEYEDPFPTATSPAPAPPAATPPSSPPPPPRATTTLVPRA